MRIDDYEKKHIFENDILYRGYHSPVGHKVCFKYYYEKSLTDEEIEILKSVQGKDYSGKACFWFSNTPEEILCNILNKSYITRAIFDCPDKTYTEIINKIYISMWDDYYNSIDFKTYSEIVDILFFSLGDNTSIEERLFSYVSVSENYDYFNYQLEKMFWSLSENIKFKDFFYSKQSENNNLIELYNKYKEDGNQISFNTIYRLTSFKDLIACLLNELISNDSIIKKCANCGKYFSPKTRTETFYCDNISPQDSTKTCKKYGNTKAYQENLKKNEARGLYRKIYMKRQMRVKRYPDIPNYKEDFENFKIESKKWKELVKDNKSLENEYIEWLKKEDYTN